MTKIKHDIPESKIRQAIWMLKIDKTKKAIYTHLGKAYNTKRLESIITEFKEKEKRIQTLKKEAQAKPISEDTEQHIISEYQNGNSLNALATTLYITSYRVKNVLLKNGVPFRARKKKGKANVSHIKQDLDIKFNIEDKVFIAPTSEFGIIKHVYDEKWIEYHSESYHSRYVALPPLKKARKKYGEDYEGIEDVHWNIYWDYDNGESWKSYAIKQELKRQQNNLIQYGIESYGLYVLGEQGHWSERPRYQLFPVANGNSN